mgnify:CR=1 FL=1
MLIDEAQFLSVDQVRQLHRLAHGADLPVICWGPVSYTHLRAHETVLDLVCRLLLEKKKQTHLHI